MISPEKIALKKMRKSRVYYAFIIIFTRFLLLFILYYFTNNKITFKDRKMYRFS